jgi:hypothetical protein
VERLIRGASVGPEDAHSLTHCGALAALEARMGLLSTPATLKKEVSRGLIYAFVAWGVPLGLAIFQLHGSLVASFLLDVEAHVRGLVAVPLLILAERPIEDHLRLVFFRMGAPPRMNDKTHAHLERQIAAARRIVGHPIAEALLLALAYVVAFRWLHAHEHGYATWISVPRDGVDRVTPAGAWEAGVVVPAYTFLLLRWLLRWGALGALFAHIARPRAGMRLIASHADRAAGLGFVSEAAGAFAWVLFAASSVASAKMTALILRGTAPPESFARPIAAAVVMSVVVACVPFFAFTPRLVRTRLHALRRYGDVVARHGARVEHEWFSGAVVTTEAASSMCDLSTVYMNVRATRFVPLEPRHLVALAAAALLPMVPVILRIVPLQQLLSFAVGAFM